MKRFLTSILIFGALFFTMNSSFAACPLNAAKTTCCEKVQTCSQDCKCPCHKGEKCNCGSDCKCCNDKTCECCKNCGDCKCCEKQSCPEEVTEQNVAPACKKHFFSKKRNCNCK